MAHFPLSFSHFNFSFNCRFQSGFVCKRKNYKIPLNCFMFRVPVSVSLHLLTQWFEYIVNKWRKPHFLTQTNERKKKKICLKAMMSTESTWPILKCAVEWDARFRLKSTKQRLSSWLAMQAKWFFFLSCAA